MEPGLLEADAIRAGSRSRGSGSGGSLWAVAGTREGNADGPEKGHPPPGPAPHIGLRPVRTPPPPSPSRPAAGRSRGGKGRPGRVSPRRPSPAVLTGGCAGPAGPLPGRAVGRRLQSRSSRLLTRGFFSFIKTQSCGDVAFAPPLAATAARGGPCS